MNVSAKFAVRIALAVPETIAIAILGGVVNPGRGGRRWIPRAPYCLMVDSSCSYL